MSRRFSIESDPSILDTWEEALEQEERSLLGLILSRPSLFNSHP